MKTTPQQDERLAQIKRANNDLREARANALERARKAAEEEVAQYQRAQDLLVRMAFNEGIPKRQIGQRGLGTSDSKTLDAALARTADAAAIAEAVTHETAAIDEAAREVLYTWDDEGGIVSVELRGDTLTRACEAEDWDTAGAAEAGVSRADFTIGQYESEARYLDTLSGDFLIEHGKRHPVVAYAITAEREAEILAWVGAQQGLAA